MQNKNIGVQCFGVKCPIIREGNDLEKIVLDSIKNAGIELQDNDVIGITESVVARANGNYVTIDDIVQFLKEHDVRKDLYLRRPIMSRNRFSMILKAFARYADSICLDYVDCPDVKTDEVGNPVWGVNPFTGIDVMRYYEEICKSENCEFNTPCEDIPYQIIDCRCHSIGSKKLQNSYKTRLLTLADIMNEPVTREDSTTSGHNKEWGLLGSNKANEETLKLFPTKSSAQKLVEQIQHKIECEYGVWVEVMVYGDGAFKSPEYNGVSIWEFADPVTSPAFTEGLNGCPNELKLKAFADGKYKDLKGKKLEDAIKNEIRSQSKNLVGSMASQGTTPRRYADLLASLFDLTTGSGSRGCPITVVQGYFNSYAD